MLQIIKEKFFDDGPINREERYEVLFSNLYWFIKVEAGIIDFYPITTKKEAINGYVIKYENKYQPRKVKDVLYLATDDTIIYQFKLIATIWFKSFFHQEKSVVEKYCSQTGGSLHENNTPSVFIPDYFDLKKEVKLEKVDQFVQFFEEVLLLKRKKYNLVIKCLSAFYNALEAFQNNYELAYSILVYMLETLVTESNEYTPVWDDYNQEKKEALEKVFMDVTKEVSTSIKKILVSDKSFKLKKRFITGVLSYIKVEYYDPEIMGTGRHLARSEMNQALENLYSSRSKYVHKLNNIDDIAKLPQFSKKDDCFFRNRAPYFTISGILRLSRHVLLNFIDTSEKVVKESYDWRSELPGIIQAELSPRYWVWQYEGFDPKFAYSNFNGFFEALVNEKVLIKIKELMNRFSKLFGSINENNFSIMFSMYCIYSFMAEEDSRPDNYNKVIEKYSDQVSDCKISYLVMAFYMSGLPDWNAVEMERIFIEYREKKYKKKKINLPMKLEIGLLSLIANKYHDEGRMEEYQLIIDSILLDCTNFQKVKDYITEINFKKCKVDLEVVRRN